MSIGTRIDTLINNTIIAAANTVHRILNLVAPFDETEAHRYLTLGGADTLAKAEEEDESWYPDELWSALEHNRPFTDTDDIWAPVGEYPEIPATTDRAGSGGVKADAGQAPAAPGSATAPTPTRSQGHTNPTTPDLLEEAIQLIEHLFIQSTCNGTVYMNRILPLVTKMRCRADDLRIFTK